MTRIGAAIITRNEEHAIAECIRSVQWMDEIVVVDDHSTDRTVEIARSLGARVDVRPLVSFSQQRNASIDLSRSEWLLHLDADMIVTPRLQEEIREAIRDTQCEAFGVTFNNYWLGRHMRHGGWTRRPILKLARRGVRFVGDVHERLDPAGPTGVLNTPMEHHTDSHYSDRLAKSNDYSRRVAREWHRQGKRFRLLPFLFAPWVRGLSSYVVHGGFRDGLVGFMWFIHVVFSTYAQHIMLWEIQRDSAD